LARRFGVNNEELQALQAGNLDVFSSREASALAFAECLTLNPNQIDDALFNKLRQHFNEGEIVEIATVAGLFNYFNRVNNALQMEPTR
jgi:alkylhydroperoxidase family enzyme